MHRRLAIALLAFALAAPAAWASDAAKTDSAKAGTPGTPGTNVDMPILVAPLSAKGKLVAYAYISATIVASSSDAAIAIRDKTPFIQDAFVRDVNGAPIGQAKAPDKPDTDALKSRLLADARRVVGGGMVAGLKFSQIQVTALRPWQSQ